MVEVQEKKAPVYTVQTECRDCYRCVRNCPVKAIRVEDSHALVMSELCVACGRCIIHCPASAKQYRNDIEYVHELLQSKETVFASIAPSFISEFPEYSSEEFIFILKTLGFTGVSETALGADFVSKEVATMLSQTTEQKLFISSCCPSSVEYIKRYMPEYSPYITNVASPLLSHARYLHSLYQNAHIVFIGPCVAKKREADVWQEIDCAITFKELRTMIEQAHISTIDIHEAKKNTKNSFIPRRAAKSELFPLEGGMIAACKKYKPLHDVQFLSVSGIEEIHQTLSGLNPEELDTPLFLETLSCSGGCINGPGTENKSSLALKSIKTKTFAQSSDDVLDEETLKNMPTMLGTLPCQKVEPKQFSEEEIRQTMRSVGKYSLADEMNCNGCGYDTCRDFAMALLNGLAEKEMCVSYMRQLANKKANGLIQTIPCGIVIVDKNMNIIECNKNFAKLMGSDIEAIYDVKPGLAGANLETISNHSHIFKQVLLPHAPDVIDKDIKTNHTILHYTIFSIEKGEVVAGVIEDVTEPKNIKERTITHAQKVINKNLETVQKIAFLLGENAAETETMLNSVIELYSLDNKTTSTYDESKRSKQ